MRILKHGYTRQRAAYIASEMKPNGVRFHHATQDSVQFKIYLLFI